MRSPVDIRNDAMECLRLAEAAKAQQHKALFVTLAQAWALLADQAEQIQEPKAQEAAEPSIMVS